MQQREQQENPNAPFAAKAIMLNFPPKRNLKVLRPVL